MQNEKRRTQFVEAHTREDYERDEANKEKEQLDPIPVDFGRIEKAPITDQDREIQRKISVPPEQLKNLIEQEESNRRTEAFKEALLHVSLSPREKECIELTLAGMRVFEIEKRLGVSDETIHTHLARAIKKIQRYLKSENKLGLL